MEPQVKRTYYAVFFAALILGASGNNSRNDEKVSSSWCTAEKLAFGAALGLLCAAAAPVALGAVGFTSAGIAANSVAAGLMSAASSSGVGLGAVAAAQSAGAAGLSTGAYAAYAVTGAAAYSYVSGDDCKLRSRCH